jgi:hypothetical protein
MNEDRAIVVEDLGQVAGMYSSVRTGLISESVTWLGAEWSVGCHVLRACVCSDV